MQPKTILYVEDNFENRLLVKRVLQSVGYTIIEAENARQGMHAAREHQPDLIIVDINMPLVDGFTLTSQLRAEPDFSMTPIIALTANVMRGDREKTLAAGCDGYIEKPIDVDHLPRQVARFLHPTSSPNNGKGQNVDGRTKRSHNLDC